MESNCKCMVIGCNFIRDKATRKEAPRKSLFRFPIDRPKLLQKWMRHIIDFSGHDYNSCAIDNNTVICEAHFEEKSFSKIKVFGEPTRSFLKPSAVPTIFKKFSREEPIKRSSKTTQTDYVLNEETEYEIVVKEDPTCRFCQKAFTGQKFEITKEIEQQFQELTQIKLLNDSNLSRYICGICNISLSYCEFWRDLFTNCQMNLLKTAQQAHKENNNQKIIVELSNIESLEEEKDAGSSKKTIEDSDPKTKSISAIEDEFFSRISNENIDDRNQQEKSSESSKQIIIDSAPKLSQLPIIMQQTQDEEIITIPDNEEPEQIINSGSSNNVIEDSASNLNTFPVIAQQSQNEQIITIPDDDEPQQEINSGSSSKIIEDSTPILGTFSVTTQHSLDLETEEIVVDISDLEDDEEEMLGISNKSAGDSTTVATQHLQNVNREETVVEVPNNKEVNSDSSNKTTEASTSTHSPESLIRKESLCPNCNSVMTEMFLGSHMESQHFRSQPSLSCDLCGYNTVTKNSIVTSQKCFRTFNDVNFLDAHYQVVHKVPREKIDIFTPVKPFNNKEELQTQKHSIEKFEATHANKRMKLTVERNSILFLCSDCGKKFLTMQLQNHIATQHKSKLFVMLYCEIVGCNTLYSQKEHYSNHILTYHADLPQSVKDKLINAFDNLLSAKQTT